MIPGTGALGTAVVRGGTAGFGGNVAGQLVVNRGTNNFNFSQAAVSGVIGATALGSGNITGLNVSLATIRSGNSANAAQALLTGGSVGNAITTTISTFGFLNQSRVTSASNN